MLKDDNMHGLLNRWTSHYDWGNTTEWLERTMNILQISHHTFYKTFSVQFCKSYSIEDMVNFEISNALGQN